MAMRIISNGFYEAFELLGMGSLWVLFALSIPILILLAVVIQVSRLLGRIFRPNT